MGIDLATAGLIASVAGTGVSAIGAMNQAAATEANARYQAEVARNNQVIAERNARYATQAGEAETTTAQLRQRATLGALAAEMGASGIDVNTGSSARVRGSAAGLGQLDTATKRHNAALRAYGYRSQSTNYGAQSGLYSQEADQAPTAGLISGGATLLSGFGGIAPKWSAWQTGGSDWGEWSPRGAT